MILLRHFTHVISSDIAFGQSPEFVALRTCLHNFFQSQIHVRIAVNKMAVQCLAVLEFDKHWVALRRGEEAERELERRIISACGVSQTLVRSH